MGDTANFKIKVILAGPSEAGKSTLANFLSDATEASAEEYRPTHVVRILEFEQNVEVKNRMAKVDVELWDTSGNLRFDKCWPALAREAHGVMFVFHPEKEQHAKQLDTFYSAFAGPQNNITDGQCMVFANVRSEDSRDRRTYTKLSSKFGRIPQQEANIDEEGNRFRSDFNTFLTKLVSGLSDRRDQEEMNIMNTKN